MAIDVESALVAKLAGNAGVAAIVSTRIHPLRIPDSDGNILLPAITYQEISAPITTTHDETAANALTQSRFQINAWATSYAGAVALGKAIFDALEGFSGIVTSGAETYTLQSVLRVDRRKDNDAETGLYWVIQDFMIWH
jgi:hypothetical protein